MPSSRKRHVARSIKPGTGLHSPKSPSDPEAWYSRGADGTCPNGTHVATSYSAYKNPKRYCVRNCSAWSPKKMTGRGGSCYRKTPWMELCNSMRAMYMPSLVGRGFDGATKREFMRSIMRDASMIYKTKFPNGKPTMAEFRSKQKSVREAMDFMVGDFRRRVENFIRATKK